MFVILTFKLWHVGRSCDLHCLFSQPVVLFFGSPLGLRFRRHSLISAAGRTLGPAPLATPYHRCLPSRWATRFRSALVPDIKVCQLNPQVRSAHSNVAEHASTRQHTPKQYINSLPRSSLDCDSPSLPCDIPNTIRKMSIPYAVYSIAIDCPDTPGDSPTPHEGILLAPAHLNRSTTAPVYFLRYTSHRTPPTKPQRKLPSWERAPTQTQTSGGGVFDGPVDQAQIDMYASGSYPITDMTLIGMCQDVNGFCKTAKAVAKFDRGASPEAARNWVADVLSSVLSQRIYCPMDQYLRDEEKAAEQRRERENSSSLTSKSIFNTRRMGLRTSLMTYE